MKRIVALACLAGAGALFLLPKGREAEAPRAVSSESVRIEQPRTLAQPRRNDADIAAGRRLFETGKLDEAMKHFARAQALEPDDWRGYAYVSMTLLQKAATEKDRRRRLGLLDEAQKVAAVLVKRGLVDLRDPLYKFIRGVALSLSGEDSKAYYEMKAALRSPASAFARYEEIELRSNVRRSYGVAALAIAARLINVAKFEDADTELAEAGKYIPEDDPNRARHQRLTAVVSEHLSQIDRAVEHLRNCIRLSGDAPEVRDELLGVIAMIYLNNERIEEGRRVLEEEADKKSNHRDLVAARCTLHYKVALRERGEALDEALRYFRKVIATYPVEERYRLVDQFVALVLAKVGPAQVEQEKSLLEEAIDMALPEIERRPECPSLYYGLYRIYKLLGDTKQEIRYQALHERKKKDWEHKEMYDASGRPRCR